MAERSITKEQNDIKERIEKFFIDVNNAHNLVFEFEQGNGKFSQKKLIEELEGLIRLTEHYEKEIPKKQKEIKNSALEKQSVKLKHAQMLVMLDLLTIDERKIKQEYIKGFIDEMEEKKDKSSKSKLEEFAEGDFGKDITRGFNTVKANYQRSQVKEGLNGIKDSSSPGHLHFAGRKLSDDRFVSDNRDDYSSVTDEKQASNYYKDLREKSDKAMSELRKTSEGPSKYEHDIQVNKVKCDSSLTGEERIKELFSLSENRSDSLGNIAGNNVSSRRTVDEYGNAKDLRWY